MGGLVRGEVVGEAAVAADVVVTGEDLLSLGGVGPLGEAERGRVVAVAAPGEQALGGLGGEGTSPSKRSTGTGAGASAAGAARAAETGSRAASRAVETSRAVLGMDLPSAVWFTRFTQGLDHGVS
ncbi:hypothetical protein GCM10018783_32080 [Streptomyces griseosporeus]|nr:hypothetical protein GCM10018783_32080 [Streptomyces griseosporeus]